MAKKNLIWAIWVENPGYFSKTQQTAIQQTMPLTVRFLLLLLFLLFFFAFLKH